MKRHYFIYASAVVFCLAELHAEYPYRNNGDATRNITNEIPTIDKSQVNTPEGYKKIPNTAQQKNANWDNVIGVSHNVTVSQACEIANSMPEASFFFYVKTYNLVLENKDGTYRSFKRGDAIFFSGEPSLGKAPNGADTYIKE